MGEVVHALAGAQANPSPESLRTNPFLRAASPPAQPAQPRPSAGGRGAAVRKRLVLDDSNPAVAAAPVLPIPEPLLHPAGGPVDSRNCPGAAAVPAQPITDSFGQPPGGGAPRSIGTAGCTAMLEGYRNPFKDSQAVPARLQGHGDREGYRSGPQGDEPCEVPAGAAQGQQEWAHVELAQGLGEPAEVSSGSTNPVTARVLDEAVVTTLAGHANSVAGMPPARHVADEASGSWHGAPHAPQGSYGAPQVATPAGYRNPFLVTPSPARVAPRPPMPSQGSRAGSSGSSARTGSASSEGATGTPVLLDRAGSTPGSRVLGGMQPSASAPLGGAAALLWGGEAAPRTPSKPPLAARPRSAEAPTFGSLLSGPSLSAQRATYERGGRRSAAMAGGSDAAVPALVCLGVCWWDPRGAARFPCLSAWLANTLGCGWTIETHRVAAQGRVPSGKAHSVACLKCATPHCSRVALQALRIRTGVAPADGDAGSSKGSEGSSKGSGSGGGDAGGLGVQGSAAPANDRTPSEPISIPESPLTVSFLGQARQSSRHFCAPHPCACFCFCRDCAAPFLWLVCAVHY